MKTNILLFSLILSLLTCNLTFAQENSKDKKHTFHNKYQPQFRKKSSIDIMGGTNIPLDNLKTFASNSIGAQITFHKFINPKFSLGLSANYDVFSKAGEIESSEKMKNLMISAGPEYSIYFGKFIWQLYGHIGSSFIQIHETQVFYPNDSQFVTEKISQQKTTIITSKLGANLGVVLSDRIRVNLNTEYIKPINNKITYQTRDLSKAERGGRIDQEAAAQIPFENVNLNLSNMSVKLGISIDFGKVSQQEDGTGNNNANNIPPPLQAQDWNSSRSNKTSKTQRTINPNGNNNPANKKIKQLSIVIEKKSTRNSSVYASMQPEELIKFNKALLPEKKILFANFIYNNINNFYPKDKVNSDDILKSIKDPWCSPCKMITAKLAGTMDIYTKDTEYLIYFSEGDKNDMINIFNKKITVNTDSNNPNGNETMIGGRGKARRECLKNGGAFMERKDSWFCMNDIQSSRIYNNGNNNNQVQKMNKRKCWRQGGTWVTNSHGSFCMGAKSNK